MTLRLVLHQALFERGTVVHFSNLWLNHSFSSVVLVNSSTRYRTACIIHVDATDGWINPSFLLIFIISFRFSLRLLLGTNAAENFGMATLRCNLFAGMALGTEQSPIKVKLIAPPIYVLSTTTLDKGAGIALLTKAIETIESTIQSKGGKLDVKMAPKAVSVKEEAELQAMMDRIAMENEEVDGDAPEDE